MNSFEQSKWFSHFKNIGYILDPKFHDPCIKLIRFAMKAIRETRLDLTLQWSTRGDVVCYEWLSLTCEIDQIRSDFATPKIRINRENRVKYKRLNIVRNRRKPHSKRFDIRLFYSAVWFPESAAWPHSIFTYRYFINNWPDLCFMAVLHDEGRRMAQRPLPPFGTMDVLCWPNHEQRCPRV